MKSKSSKIISILVTAALVFGLFSAMPLTVHAESSRTVINLSDSWFSGAAYSEFADSWAYSPEVPGQIDSNTLFVFSDVTVIGVSTGVSKPLEIRISENAKVTWAAAYTGSTRKLSSLIILNGNGMFEVAEGGCIKNYGEGLAIFNITEDNGHDGEVDVTVSGGEVSAVGDAILLFPSFRTTPATGRTVTVNSGAVTSSGGGTAISNKSGTVIVNGGRVSVSGGLGGAINGGDSSTIRISGGIVDQLNDRSKYPRYTGNAIQVGPDSPGGKGSGVTINGGFVFSSGNGISGQWDVVVMLDAATIATGTPDIGGISVVCAWDQDAGRREYQAGASDDLTVKPDGATAVWGTQNGQAGIFYSNTLHVPRAAANTGFYPISGITISDASTKPATKPAMTNFVRVNAYKALQFADVNENAWYGNNQQKVIARAFEYGLMKGNSDTAFNPAGNVTIAEAIAIASRVHNIYTGGNESFVQGTPWYQVYIDYAITNGIIKANDFTNYTRAATRAEMAYIFASALPKEEFKGQNTVNSLPDVNSGAPYSEAIFMLYKAGVVGGSDEKGTFNPASNIIRAEAAAIISRVILPDTRISGKTY